MKVKKEMFHLPSEDIVERSVSMMLLKSYTLKMSIQNMKLRERNQFIHLSYLLLTRAFLLFHNALTNCCFWLSLTVCSDVIIDGLTLNLFKTWLSSYLLLEKKKFT